MALTNVQLKQTKPAAKPQKLFDGGGLFLLITPAGQRYWRLKYRYQGKEKLLALGVYPEVSLAKARKLRDEAREKLAENVDPSDAKKTVKRQALLEAANSFEQVAREWFDKQMTGLSKKHQDRTWNRLEADIFPWLGKRPVNAIEAPEILECLRRIEKRGAVETAGRVRWSCSQVFRYAIASGMAKHDPAEILKGALARPTAKPFPTITDPAEVGALLRALDGLEASLVVMCAARLAPILFVRPGELRHAEWSEFDLDKAEWRIPAEKMKSRAMHLVPLPVQAIYILRELQPLTGNGKYVFPGERTRERPMSENTINAALRRLGYAKDEFTGHSFRKIASTLLNESHLWHRDAIERQLAHGERDEVRAAYNYAEYLPERKKMMQWWADHLEQLKAGSGIVSRGGEVA
ncbi:tyrosine-type recombinase/integrase [Burkholderia anthina]|uniref:tyrosine-type recombinase/integrase n=1 Tax=Burkholderia anthina TaxID=179879 RepID=UPI00158F1B69|nr:integrase arm-type DNA-binding domain-containing protein [Burkholderia anthina]